MQKGFLGSCRTLQHGEFKFALMGSLSISELISTLETICHNSSMCGRSETVTTMPSFREAFKSQRCLIPADGFYEWAKNGKSKQPYCFEVGDGDLFAFAGLWDRWTDPRGEVVESCTILTTTPNALLADIHDRMPAILRPDDYDLWLNPTGQNTESALRLLSPYTGPMRRYPVSTRVNQVQNDDADCTKPVELEVPAQSQLFG